MTPANDPDDIWNLLPKCYPRYPKRKDRDALVARAQADPKNCLRRVEIWDFFFPVDKEKLLEDLQTEKAELLAEQARLKDELVRDEQRIAQEIARLRDQALAAKSRWEKWSAEFLANIKKRHDIQAKLFERGAYLLFAILIVMAVSSIDADDFTSSCLFFLAFPVAGLGLVLIVLAKVIRSGLKAQDASAQKHEAERLANHLAQLDQEDSRLASWLNNKRAYIESRVAELNEKVFELERRMAKRVRQIPKIPSSITVHKWFKKELAELTTDIYHDSGKEGNTARFTSAPDHQFQLNGPAELHDQRQIDEFFRTDEDLQKHIAVKQAGNYPEVGTIDLYGVWIVDVLILGNHDFTSARATFDFITKHKVIKFRTHPYNAVALIENGSNLRRVEVIRNGKPSDEVIEDVPSFSFTLENGQKIDVSFRYPNYLKQLFPDINLPEPSYDDCKKATEAVKILRQKVHEARLQAGSQNEGGPGPLGQNWDDLDSPPTQGLQ